jgi:hypothetical protein
LKKRAAAARRSAKRVVRKVRAARPASKPRRTLAPQKSKSKKSLKATPKKKTAKRAVVAVAAEVRTVLRPRLNRSPTPPVRLERERRRLPDAERIEAPNAPPESRMIAAARAGHDELKEKLQRHTETSPTLTAGDLDAKWEDAYAVGDEAPGGDNPTPEQDRVDDIGRALGVEYQDDQELQGGDEIAERDQHRWELDPASSDDWPHDKDKDR